MPLTDSYLAACRLVIQSLPELTAFRSALAVTETATRADRVRSWHATYDDAQAGHSPAYRLRRAVRDVVNAQADASITLLERESAYRTLVTEVVPEMARPLTDEQETEAFEKLLREDRLS